MPTSAFQIPENLKRWLDESAGIPSKLLLSLERDDDWTFVIKMHGILEAGLNHLLLTQFGNPKLAALIPKLQTNNKRTGKIAFIKAYALLSEGAQTFISLFSDVRNRAVHDVKNFDLNLVAYLAALDSNEKKKWKGALTSWMISPPSEMIRNLSIRNPRGGIYYSCMTILIQCYQKHTEAEAQRKRILSALQLLGNRTMFEGFGKP